MAGDHFCAAADDDLVDIAADLNLVMGVGHWHRIVVAAVAHHGDRTGPGADFLAGVIGCGRQHHQGVEVTQETLADGLGMAAQNLVLAFETLLLQPGVQVVEAVEAGHRYKVVPPAKADHPFDVALVVALARPAKPVLEQVMRLQLRERSGALPGSVAKDARHGNRGVVVEH